MDTTREVIVGKVQAALGTAEALNPSTDAIQVMNPQLSFVDTNMVSRPIKKATKGQVKQLYSGTLVQLTFDAEVKGSGVVGTPPELAHSLVVCGLAETITGGVSVGYKPASSGQQYMTLDYYQDGKIYKLYDAVGNVSAKLDAGMQIIFSFTMTGHLHSVVDSPFVSGSYDSTVPPLYINRPFDIGGYAADISALAFDLGNEIKKPKSVASADGFGALKIGARDVTGSFDPLDTLIATHDFVDEWQSGAALALNTGVIGSTAGNQVQITMPAVSYRSVGQTDRESLRAFDIGFGAAEVSGDDEIEILFT